jgi:DNA-binding SARP family transcriptional activator/predicted negative regulator of RcsB-dependent stress response
MNSGSAPSPRSQATVPYRLRVLGRLALEDGPGLSEGAAGRRRSLALLAILAAAGEQGVPRDKLLLYLWPESDTKRARNSLHQTLYALRQQLGQDAILAGIPNLQLNPARCSSDLWDFDAAVARGDIETAIGLYGGPFLDGFSLPELVEFEQWMEEERTRIARRYADALEAAAVRAGRDGMHRLAVERWQRLARLEPLSSRPVVGLIRALAAAGDRASALAQAKVYEELVLRELGTAADPAVTALVEQLRSSPTPAPTTRVQVGGPPTAAEPARATAAAASERRPPGPRVWRAAVAVLVVIDALAIGTWWWTRHRAAHPPSEPALVAVFPFAVEGSPDAQYLAAGMVDLLATDLEGAGDIRSVDPEVLLGGLARQDAPVRTPDQARAVAARFGAGRYVLGSVVASGGRLHLRAAMYEAKHGDEPTARATVEGAASELFGLVDQLTARLLAQEQRGPGERLARVAASTTSSLEALKSYLAGERELRAGRYVPALEAFREAVARDSGFALAHYRLSIAAEWSGQDSLARAASAAAARFDARLSEHDRMLVRALVARRSGDLAESERLYRAVVDDYPDDVEAWLQLGELLFQANPLRGRSSAEARPAFERVLALDPENEEALVHLARIASIEGRRAAMDTLMQRLIALGPSAEVLETRAFRAFALGDREAWKRVTRELIEDPPDVPAVTALAVATYLDDLDGAEDFADLLRDRRYSGDVRGMAYRLLARVAVARGQWSAAQAQLDSAARFDATAALELRSLFAVLPFLLVPRTELLEIRGQVERWDARLERPGEPPHTAAHAGLHPSIRRYRLGLLDAALEDTTAALAEAAALGRVANASTALEARALRTFARSIRARVASLGGRPAEALADIEGADWELVESQFESEALDRWYRGELLYTLGRKDEALDWYRTIAERATYELVYVAPARLRQGDILESKGDDAGAREAYRTAARLWHEADPRLRPLAADAAARLSALSSAVR